jgi:hypothetical protein
MEQYTMDGAGVKNNTALINRSMIRKSDMLSAAA